jgi:hypothetical protein
MREGPTFELRQGCMMRPTSSAELQTIVWTIIVVALILGSIGLWYSFGAPEAKADVAAKLRFYSLACWAFAAAVYGGYRALDYLG